MEKSLNTLKLTMEDLTTNLTFVIDSVIDLQKEIEKLTQTVESVKPELELGLPEQVRRLAE